MAQTRRQLADKLRAFNFEAEADKIIMKNADFAIRLNQNQLLDGEMPNDKPIEPSYLGNSYAAFKNKKNPRPTLGTPDLNLTGGNYNGIRLVKKSVLTYSLENINSKAPSLIKKYGNYMGLQKINLKSLTYRNDTDLFNEWIRKTGL